jgi:DnaJ-class molecular chaperone
MRDPYHTLGVDRAASGDDIKSAYRRLAKRYHPDLNPGRPDIEQRFKEVNAAYTILSDPDKRARFDRGEIDGAGAERGGARYYRRAHAESGANTQQTREDPFAGFGFGDDPFSDLFGSGRRRASSGVKQRGSDVAYSVTVNFTDACLGTKRRLILSTGKAIDVNIPPGTEDQQRLRLKGQGLGGLGGAEAGDAIVEIHVEAHPHMTRQGSDIHLDIPVSLPEAVLGATVRVPTLDGAVAVKVPPGSNTGTVLRLKGKGVPATGGQRGDQFVRITVMLPDQPDAELTQFVERWAQRHSYDVRRKLSLD